MGWGGGGEEVTVPMLTSGQKNINAWPAFRYYSMALLGSWPIGLVCSIY